MLGVRYLAFMPASTDFGKDVVARRNDLSVLIMNFVHVEAIVEAVLLQDFRATAYRANIPYCWTTP
jgi:hypothetical protein